VIMFSHRSYLDGLLLPRVLNGHGISPAFVMGGSNLNFFPVGGIASRSGVVFIRRDIKDQPVYRFTLRSYISQLIQNRQNLSWSIEGGRTRTGKLRPPVYGILRYVVDAAEAVAGPEVLVLPVSIVYDQLHEVAGMTAEALGGKKTPEGLQWMLRYLRQQRTRLGRAYLDFGEPVPLRERLAEIRGDTVSAAQDGERDDGHQVERLALDVCYRINQVTPITTTAAVTLAMLAADRALSLDEVLRTVDPLARYLANRHWQIAGGANLADRATVRLTLQELTSSGVLNSYDGGNQTVWGICSGQHLVAAFYRNTAIHALVDRAIGEVSVLAATEAPGEIGFWQAAWKASLRLRDLLKFEFFFASRRQYAEAMREEMSLIDPQRDWVGADLSADEARMYLRRAQPLLAHLVLRPFLDAYLVVADQLASYGDDEFEEATFLEDCLGVARQRALQRRIASAESISLELFKTALRLARHRGLLETDDLHLDKRRRDFATELADAVRRVNAIDRMAWAQAATEVRER
jgi:glycerol-3-phosphate O-acyltransferase